MPAHTTGSYRAYRIAEKSAKTLNDLNTFIQENNIQTVVSIQKDVNIYRLFYWQLIAS